MSTLNAVIYTRAVVPAAQSADGETPVMVVVTEERNGYFVWLTDHDGARLLHFERFDRDRALEIGVDLGRYDLDVLMKGAWGGF